MNAPRRSPAAMQTRMSGGPPGDWKMEEKPPVGDGGGGGVNDGLKPKVPVGRNGSLVVVDMLGIVQRADSASGSGVGR